MCCHKLLTGGEVEARMSPEVIERAFAEMKYDGDDRRAPDERRRARFRTGWADATKRSECYSVATLKRLTWNNLGYRFGRQFGSVAPDQIDAVYQHLSTLWERIWGAASETASSAAPSADQYTAAFRNLVVVTDSQSQMLRYHYNAPSRTVTATQMAEAVGFGHYSIANSQYGRLGRLVGDELEYNPMKERLGTLVTFEKRNEVWHWVMRPQVAEALERLGWIGTVPAPLLTEATKLAVPLVEGAVSQEWVTVYERNPEARRQCIAAHGSSCCVCGFNFGAVYGAEFAGFIHVHHRHPVSEAGGEYAVHPIEDLRPVCPNCHAVIHHGGDLRGINEVRQLLAANKHA